jgi:lysozyme
MTSAQRKAAALAIATALAIPAEGIFTRWYFDPVGIATVCVGHTKNVDKSKVYTVAECKALLNKEMGDVLSRVDTCRPGLPINVLAAFADLSYNVGQHVVCDETKSTAARMLSSGDYDGACKQILKWTKAKVMGVYTDLPGLVKRRQMEYDICRQWR